MTLFSEPKAARIPSLGGRNLFLVELGDAPDERYQGHALDEDDAIRLAQDKHAERLLAAPNLNHE